MGRASSTPSDGSSPPPAWHRSRSFLQHGFSGRSSGGGGSLLGRCRAGEGVHFPSFCVACVVTNVLVMLVEFSANGWRVEPLGINWSVGVSAETLVEMGAKVTSRIVWRREWWRLLTASWLHGGLFHLGLNLALLWQLGAPLERAYGAWAIAPLYLTSGVYGVVTSALLLPAVGLGPNPNPDPNPDPDPDPSPNPNPNPNPNPDPNPRWSRSVRAPPASGWWAPSGVSS